MTSVSFVSYIVALMKIMIHNQSSLELLNVNFKLYFNHNTYILYNIQHKYACRYCIPTSNKLSK